MKYAILIGALVLSTAASAKDLYDLKISKEDLAVVGAALGDLPFKTAAPVVQRLVDQVRVQDATVAAPAPAKQDAK